MQRADRSANRLHDMWKSTTKTKWEFPPDVREAPRHESQADKIAVMHNTAQHSPGDGVFFGLRRKHP